MKRENCVLIIAGPSAVGKTVVAKSIVDLDSRYTFLRSGTTRPKRGDKHDDEYLYYTEEEFLAAVARGEFAEHMRYGGNFYGTPKSELKRALDAGKIPLMVLDLVGVESLSRLEEYSSCAVYVYTDPAVIENRLYQRYLSQGETPDGLKSYNTRCEQNKRDFGVIANYSDYFFKFIKNDSSIESCRDKVMDAFRAFADGEEADLTIGREISSSLAESVK